jgi:hypothetical protein
MAPPVYCEGDVALGIDWSMVMSEGDLGIDPVGSVMFIVFMLMLMLILSEQVLEAAVCSTEVALMEADISAGMSLMVDSIGATAVDMAAPAASSAVGVAMVSGPHRLSANANAASNRSSVFGPASAIECRLSTKKLGFCSPARSAALQSALSVALNDSMRVSIEHMQFKSLKSHLDC